MKKEVLTRTILDTTVTKALHDLETDTNRGIRNLIDLALTFSSGRFQKAFFEAAQRMLRNESSAYYQLTKYLVTEFDHEAIKTFGINIGYNSCTYGARLIREKEAEYEFNIPWTIAFDRERNGSSMEEEEIEAGISQGVELGIFTYQIFYGSGFQQSDLELFKRHPDCAFIICLPPAVLTEEIADEAAGIHHVLFSLESGTGLKKACAYLRDKRIPFFIHTFYGDENAEDIRNDRWVEGILPEKPIFAILFARRDCGRDTRKRVEEYVLEVRNEQSYPLVLLDAWSDILKIDRIISDDSCSIGFSADGTLFGADSSVEGSYSLKENSLRDILSKTMPKKAGTVSNL